jgi:hydrogenase nickel incorporation protein HypB
MFRRSSAMVVNKTDLLGLSDFDLDKVIANARSINGNLQIFKTSCQSSDGLQDWYLWLRRLIGAKRAGERSR